MGMKRAEMLPALSASCSTSGRSSVTGAARTPVGVCLLLLIAIPRELSDLLCNTSSAGVTSRGTEGYRSSAQALICLAALSCTGSVLQRLADIKHPRCLGLSGLAGSFGAGARCAGLRANQM